GDQADFVIARGEDGPDQRVALLDVDGDDAVLAIVAEVGQARLLELAAARGKEDEEAVDEGGVLVLLPVSLDAENRSNLLVGLEIEEVLDRAPLGGAAALGYVEDALDVDPTRVGEEHQVVVRGGGEEVLDKVGGFVLVGGFARFHALESLAAARLGAVFGGRGALDVA